MAPCHWAVLLFTAAVSVALTPHHRAAAFRNKSNYLFHYKLNQLKPTETLEE